VPKTLEKLKIATASQASWFSAGSSASVRSASRADDGDQDADDDHVEPHRLDDGSAAGHRLIARLQMTEKLRRERRRGGGWPSAMCHRSVST
jgi:hypothetical protein